MQVTQMQTYLVIAGHLIALFAATVAASLAFYAIGIADDAAKRVTQLEREVDERDP